MCGIIGFIGKSIDANNLALKMTDAIQHRGPDSKNIWLSAKGNIALGQARLAIIDVSDAGAQPMHSHTGRFVISFNGEIYNHRAIRDELQRTGNAPVWKGASDTESFVAALDVWGVKETLQKCVGMFAIAIWDNDRKELTLVRDRFGEKPLYYLPQSDGVVFASEVSAIELHPACDRQVCQDAVLDLAESGYIAAPLSIYEGVYKLMPGSLAVFNDNGFVSTEQWWSPVENAVKQNDAWKGSFDEATIELERVLDVSVRRQLVADVPLGAFLSGGIDSSLIVALMQKNHSCSVKTFSLGFNDAEFDEAHYASQVAKHLGTDHTEHYVSNHDVAELVPSMMNVYSEPFADSSQLPTYLVSKLSRQDVTVALTGDAGDEIFAGYNRHLFANNHWSTIKKVPVMVRNAGVDLIKAVDEKHLNKLSKLVPGGSNWTRVGEKLKQSGHVLSAKTIQDLYRHSTRANNIVFKYDDKPSSPLSNCPQSDLIASMELSVNNSLHRLGSMRWMMVKDQLDYMPNDILVKVDRAAMACGLETRAPFLDHTVVQFANSLPSHMLANKALGKLVLREILSKHIPREYFERPKMGFSVPIHDMLRGPLKEWAAEHLSEQAINKSGSFDSKQVNMLWSQHLSGNKNHVDALWPVLMFQSWHAERIR